MTDSLDLGRLWVILQVASYMQISHWTVRELVRTRGLPAYRVGRQLRFDPAKVGRWLQENEGKPRRQVRAPRRRRRARALKVAS